MRAAEPTEDSGWGGTAFVLAGGAIAPVAMASQVASGATLHETGQGRILAEAIGPVPVGAALFAVTIPAARLVAVALAGSIPRPLAATVRL